MPHHHQAGDGHGVDKVPGQPVRHVQVQHHQSAETVVGGREGEVDISPERVTHLTGQEGGDGCKLTGTEQHHLNYDQVHGRVLGK